MKITRSETVVKPDSCGKPRVELVLSWWDDATETVRGAIVTVHDDGSTS